MRRRISLAATAAAGVLLIGSAASAAVAVGKADSAAALGPDNASIPFAGASGSQSPPAVTRYGVPTSRAPEPAAWALMIFGFGMAGVLFRRQRALLS